MPHAAAKPARSLSARHVAVAGLGPLLCWAVVFADIGTSVYYTPGILFNQVGMRAALFVSMTLVVFVLLTLKYSEVAIRYPHGGGVVSVGAHAVNNFVGLLGGVLILVDYFLTSSLSALSGLIYFSLVAPGMKGVVVPLTVAALVVLAGLNLYGIRADARVTAVIAMVALGSQLAVVLALIAHVGLGQALGAVSKVFAGPPLTGVGLLTGYAGAFLAFSGLESISQLAPAMRKPNRRTAPRAMLIVVITVALTSPFLTLWSTTLINVKGSDPNQFISVLGGFAAGPMLMVEVAASAALLLVFASNTAIIGCYHVFLALSRMRFLPRVLQHTNRWRRTPQWAILTATVVPILIVVLTNGNVGLLGDMYAFGLLGAFSVTCVCLDIVRWRERRSGRSAGRVDHAPRGEHVRVMCSTPMFVIGVITSVLVVTAWTTNLFAKPLATLFGGVVTLIGLAVAGVTYYVRRRAGLPGPVPAVHRFDQSWAKHPSRLHPLLVLLNGTRAEVDALIEAGLELSGGRTVVFAYAGEPSTPGVPVPRRILEIVDPYLDDEAAQAAFSVLRKKVGRHRPRVHTVYIAEPDRRTALSELREHLRPSRIITLAGDRSLLDGEAVETMQRDGVALAVSAAEPVV